ncbi:uncharacterized protein LOC142776293 isoform X1 [Rhipicephalus microplus]|uniref:uncharacterized protein LOC142776293 isoform X1 n=1 Tax=Rhipicephalus microplus TaxID=6941 RepID=UPI003F6C2FA5
MLRRRRMHARATRAPALLRHNRCCTAACRRSLSAGGMKTCEERPSATNAGLRRSVRAGEQPSGESPTRAAKPASGKERRAAAKGSFSSHTSSEHAHIRTHPPEHAIEALRTLKAKGVPGLLFYACVKLQVSQAMEHGPAHLLRHYAREEDVLDVEEGRRKCLGEEGPHRVARHHVAAAVNVRWQPVRLVHGEWHVPLGPGSSDSLPTLRDVAGQEGPGVGPSEA